MLTFDRIFGKDFMATVPAAPGVYRFYLADGTLFYVGKAVCLRKRLAQYRRTTRRKCHRKARQIVKACAGGRIEFETCPTHLDACLTELALIQRYRPRANTAGAFSFMYPMIGVKREGDAVYLCYTTTPGLFEHYAFHGAYRTRSVTRDGFFGLCRLLRHLGLGRGFGNLTPHKYSYVQGFRAGASGVADEWLEELAAMLRGESDAALRSLVLRLLEWSPARQARAMVQENIELVRALWRRELEPFGAARAATATDVYPVPQDQRDAMFVRYRELREAQEKAA